MIEYKNSSMKAILSLWVRQQHTRIAHILIPVKSLKLKPTAKVATKMLLSWVEWEVWYMLWSRKKSNGRELYLTLKSPTAVKRELWSRRSNANKEHKKVDSLHYEGDVKMEEHKVVHLLRLYVHTSICKHIFTSRFVSS